MPSLLPQSKQIIRVGSSLLDLSEPKVMGILNITPDSFYDGGRYQTQNYLIERVQQMVKEEVDIVDIGGYSSRPGADDISIAKEKRRVLRALEVIKTYFPELPVSVDTFRAEVADEAISNGANIINDISGGDLDAKMYEIVAKYQVPYILMHMRGTPQTMTKLNNYENILLDIVTYFEKKVHILRELEVRDIIIDPGFGFAKNIKQNYFILQNLAQLHCLDLAILIGVSRKSMIYKTLAIDVEDALNGTTALNMFALSQGASILRVHDVKAAKEVIKIWQKLQTPFP